MKKTMGFRSFLIAQALGAFNDNAFKTFVALLAVATMPMDQSGKLIAMAGALFIIPFLLFSTFAGTVADRWSKKKLIVIFKAIEIALTILSGAALYLNSIPFLLVLLFLAAGGGGYYAKVKYINPHILHEKQMMQAVEE